jgi:hypothetical protein
MKKSLIINIIVFGIISLALLLVGGYIAGWDIVGFFTSPMFLLIVFGVIVFAMIIVFIYFKGGD